MQCHGGLKGPLRRIIRSLGNDAASRSHLQRQRIRETSIGTGTLLEESQTARDRLPQPPRRPHTGYNPRFLCRSTRTYSTQSSATLSSSGPQEEPEAAHNSRLLDPHIGHEQAPPGLSAPAPAPAQEGVKIRFKASARRASDDSTPSFDDAILSSINRPTDGAGHRRTKSQRAIPQAPVKDTDDYSARYGANYRSVHIDGMKRRSRANQIQQKRHDYAASNDWRGILRMLDENTPAGRELYEKKLETIMLPAGLLAKFKRDAGASIKEIMDHTGCHVQITSKVLHQPQSADAFTGLDLLGYSSQIADAVKVLLRYLDVMPAGNMFERDARSSLNDYIIERKVQPDEAATLAELSAPTTGHQEDQGIPKIDMESIEHEINRKVDKPVSSTVPIRSVWTDERGRKLKTSGLLGRRPESLADSLQVSAYVAELCQTVPQSARQAFHQTATPATHPGHVTTVKESLLSLFSSPRVAQMATSSTVDRAIQFILKHSDFGAFRELYNALDEAGYDFTAQNWNCCLAAAAKASDVHNYHYTLKLMLRNTIKPNPGTWATFHDLMCRKFPSKAELVAGSMRHKGLLWNNEAAKLVAQNSVSNELKAHLTLRPDLTSFLERYDNRFRTTYGLGDFNWLTIDVVNRMVHVLLSFGKSRDAFEVLNEFRKRNDGGSGLQTATLNIFLTSSLRDLDPASAVATLQHFRIGYDGALIPDEISYKMLFAIAWRGRYFNMLRVVWRYACASGHIDYRMRHRMARSLDSLLPAQIADKSRQAVWRAFAAKFAVGISGGLDSEAATMPENDGKPLHGLPLGELQSASELSKQMRSSLRPVLTFDISKGIFCQPVLPLADILGSAWEKDREWKERGLGLPKNYKEDMFGEMLEEAISVPMVKGDGTLETRDWEIPALLRLSQEAADIGTKKDESKEG